MSITEHGVARAEAEAKTPAATTAARSAPLVCRNALSCPLFISVSSKRYSFLPFDHRELGRRPGATAIFVWKIANGAPCAARYARQGPCPCCPGPSLRPTPDYPGGRSEGSATESPSTIANAYSLGHKQVIGRAKSPRAFGRNRAAPPHMVASRSGSAPALIGRSHRRQVGQSSGNSIASQRAMAAFTATGFSCAIQWPDATVTSARRSQSRRMGSASRVPTVADV